MDNMIEKKQDEKKNNDFQKLKLIKPDKKSKKDVLLAQLNGLECTNNKTIC